ncbi:hypothetical protein J8273_4851 [Carpediemonas membranifera]|uniref:Uncharacterized protein n=1 Tax=Carpediemonas membranifera TaxID=201153 RepID=A0A8J6BB81_9EUKA|nr:hypothetical protein J8273_4851 [Carpediemonas membranifera]|eukprot:KAG9393732.1 hypothetical protein J8273_4851 [Carpediemonas membranifera]
MGEETFYSVASTSQHELRQEDAVITSLTFASNGQHLTTGLSNGHVLLWKVTDRALTLLHNYSTSLNRIHSIYIADIVAEGEAIQYMWITDGSIQIADLEAYVSNGEFDKVPLTHFGTELNVPITSIRGLTESNDEQYLALCGLDLACHMDMASGDAVSIGRVPGAFDAALLSVSQSTLMAVASPSALTIMRCDNDPQMAVLAEQHAPRADPFTALAVGNGVVLMGQNSGTLTLFSSKNAPVLVPVASVELESSILSIAVRSEQTREAGLYYPMLVAVVTEKSVSIYEDMQLHFVRQRHGNFGPVAAWSEDGTMLAYASKEGKLQITHFDRRDAE